MAIRVSFNRNSMSTTKKALKVYIKQLEAELKLANEKWAGLHKSYLALRERVQAQDYLASNFVLVAPRGRKMGANELAKQTLERLGDLPDFMQDHIKNIVELSLEAQQKPSTETEQPAPKVETNIPLPEGAVIPEGYGPLPKGEVIRHGDLWYRILTQKWEEPNKIGWPQSEIDYYIRPITQKP